MEKYLKNFNEFIKLNETKSKSKKINYNPINTTYNGIDFVSSNTNDIKPNLTSIRQQGDGNSNYGNRWMKNLETGEDKLVNQDDWNKYTKLGWEFGRIGNGQSADEKDKEIVRQKLKNAMIGRQGGVNNPNYGNRWMKNIETGEHTLVNSDDFDKYKKKGWVFGRIGNGQKKI